MKAIILVAGYATRLYPITENKPKSLLEINNKPILDYIVNEINEIEEITEIFVVSNNKFIHHFKDWLKNIESKIEITIINDGTNSVEDRLGAIGDIQLVIEQQNIKEDVIIIAGDNFFTYKLKAVYDFYVKNNKNCVVSKEYKDKSMLSSFAVATLDSNNVIIELEEKPQKPKSNICIYATYIYKKDTVKLVKKYLDEGNNKDAPGYFLAWVYNLKPTVAYRIQESCYDIGTKEVYEEVQNLFK